jgi:cell division septal protein FtsQ
MQRREGKRLAKKQRADVIVEIDVRAVVALVITVVMGLLCALCLFLYARSFLGIKKFELIGMSRYDEADVVDASGLKLGNRLYTLDFDKVEEKILAECPYLQSVEITAKFPHTVRFSVEERIPQWYLDIAGDYYVLDNTLTVMTEVASDQGLIAEGVTKLRLPNVTRVIKGELPTFATKDGETDQTELRKTLELITIVRQSTFKERMTELDLSDRFNMKMTVDGSYYVSLGDMSGFEAKLRKVEELLNSEMAKQYPSAEIDVSTAGLPATFKPIH